jgi:hypothetical protein
MYRFTMLWLITCWLLTSTAYSQISEPRILTAAEKIAHDYFRVSPFNKDFSTFVSRLINDPSVADKKIHLKTDSTLFFMEAAYTKHQPFFFKPEKVKVIISERETEADSLHSPQPFFIYQLVGYAPAGKDGKTDVEKEYEKLVKKYTRSFDMNQPRELKDGETVTGEIRDFYFANVSFAPVTLAWSSNAENGNVFAITIRFLVFDNRAFLPIATNRF